MTRGEQTGLAFMSTMVSWLPMNPILSAVASIFAIVLSGMLIYKTYLDIQHRHELRKKDKQWLIGYSATSKPQSLVRLFWSLVSCSFGLAKVLCRNWGFSLSEVSQCYSSKTPKKMAAKNNSVSTHVSKSRKRRKHAKCAKHGNKTKPNRGQGRWTL